ncbi:hypothetical protein AAFN85_13835 [Mucilaginibacter sp. CAU 1740]|uniref:hypothetical protein n=1 Tax=Mucilaginibacter sp. CAU 1740 TaxID=3140365 RepID=UPI00325B19CD
MNHLLHQITWHQYLTATFTAAIVYYVFIGWKYYRSEISLIFNLLTGKKDDRNELPAALQYQGEENQSAEIPSTAIPAFEKQEDEPFQGAARSLANRLTGCIDEAADEPFAPDKLIIKLKKILNDHPDVAATPEREAINALIVSECEKTGTALLSRIEVDMWWSV